MGTVAAQKLAACALAHHADRLRQATDLILAEASARTIGRAALDPSAVTELLIAVTALAAAAPAAAPPPPTAGPPSATEVAEREAARPSTARAKPPSLAESKWLTAAEVAKLVRRDPSTVRRVAELWDLHGHQPMRGGYPVLGSRLTFASSAVDAWIQGHDERAQREACGCNRRKP